MSDATALRRQLQIKTGVVKRLSKENAMYLTETEQQKSKLDKLVASGSEDDDHEWNVKNAQKMLEESNKMVADTRGKLEKAAGDLRDLVADTKGDSGIADSEEYKKAEAALESIS